MCGFFYGWYLKCQSDTQTLAVIPAIHWSGGKRGCSIQFITEDGTWTAAFPPEAFWREGKSIFIESSRFGEKGMRLAIHEPELEVTGKLSFGTLSPLKYDIMGPFSLVPFLECRHDVRSMQHSVCGRVSINGKEYVFREAKGYWEGDRGRSFPKQYAWTQCCIPGGSLMLAVADIPIMGWHFCGIIGVVSWHGREYRLATYLGAKAAEIRNGMIRIVQGSLELEARLLEKAGNPLKAPKKGDMARIIHENAACRAFYCFRRKGCIIFSLETNRASFEYEYPY